MASSILVGESGQLSGSGRASAFSSGKINQVSMVADISREMRLLVFEGQWPFLPNIEAAVGRSTMSSQQKTERGGG